MALVRKIQRLEDLCLDQVISEVEDHARKFERCQPESIQHILYRISQHIFSLSLPEVLERIHRTDRDYTDLRRFADLPCLKFLLSEFITQVCVKLFAKVYTFSTEDFLVALRQCKDLRYLEMKNSRFSRQVFLSTLPEWKNLLGIDLLNSSCDDEIFINILKNCPEIRVLRVTGKSLTEKALLNLCESNRDSKVFHFCGRYGECCHLGKKITSLKLYGTQVGIDGLACALQHLKSLKVLEDGALFLESEISSRLFFDTTCVYNAVDALRKAHESHHLLHPQLQLQTLLIPLNVNFAIHTDLELFRTLECCPTLETLYVECPSIADYLIFTLGCFRSLRTLYLDFGRFAPLRLQSSQHFLQFLETTGHQLETVSISGVKLTLRLIKIILRNCYNLKQLHIGFKKCFTLWTPFTTIIPSHDGFSEDNADLCARAKNLETIRFRRVLLNCERAERFLCNFLIEATNVKFLIISGNLVERSLRRILKSNMFPKLEEISIHDADVEHVSLHPLLRHNSNLRKITYSRCENTEPFVRQLLQEVERRNLQVIIEEVTSR